MASLSDIPPEFLFRFAKQKFIDWLKLLPTDKFIIRELAQLWQEFNKTRWNKDDYKNLGL